jgi:hypothetical protein
MGSQQLLAFRRIYAARGKSSSLDTRQPGLHVSISVLAISEGWRGVMQYTCRITNVLWPPHLILSTTSPSRTQSYLAVPYQSPLLRVLWDLVMASQFNTVKQSSQVSSVLFDYHILIPIPDVKHFESIVKYSRTDWSFFGKFGFSRFRTPLSRSQSRYSQCRSPRRLRHLPIHPTTQKGASYPTPARPAPRGRHNRSLWERDCCIRILYLGK